MAVMVLFAGLIALAAGLLQYFVGRNLASALSAAAAAFTGATLLQLAVAHYLHREL
jgi:hypothetical protein